jgi:hypothetical protein
MATKRKLAEQDIMELILESDSLTHSYQKAIPVFSDDSDTDEIIDTNCIQWADNNTADLPYLWSTGLQGSQCVTTNRSTSHY